MIRVGIFLFAVLVHVGNTQAKPVEISQPQLIEIFTSSAYPVDVEQSQKSESNIAAHYYKIDGIHQLESRLSQNLPADPEVAKSLAIKHLSHLNKDAINDLQQSAIGLSKVMQYGINRYPAIVFDGELVIYGVTNLQQALEYYQQWHKDQVQQE